MPADEQISRRGFVSGAVAAGAAFVAFDAFVIAAFTPLSLIQDLRFERPGRRYYSEHPPLLAAQRSLVDLSVSSNGMLEVSGSLPAGASTCAFCFRLLWVEYPTDGDYRLRALGIGCAGIFGPPTFDRKPPIRGGDSFRVP